MKKPGEAHPRSVLAATLGTIAFVLTVPASVVVLGPWLVSGWRLQPPFLGTSVTRWVGIALIVFGLPLAARAMTRFVVQGRGTPAPWVPTQRLVSGGPFLYVRNPMYVGVLALIVGQALLLGSRAVLLYGAVTALVFHLFVLLYEEPHLRRVYGDQYAEYCRQVPRWIPRLRR